MWDKTNLKVSRPRIDTETRLFPGTWDNVINVVNKKHNVDHRRLLRASLSLTAPLTSLNIKDVILQTFLLRGRLLQQIKAWL